MTATFLCDCGDRYMVVDSRWLSKIAARRRRKACRSCGHRITTYEKIDVDKDASVDQLSAQIDKTIKEVLPLVVEKILQARERSINFHNWLPAERRQSSKHWYHQIAALRDSGCSLTEIASRASVSQSTLYDLVNPHTRDKRIRRSTELKLVSAWPSLSCFTREVANDRR